VRDSIAFCSVRLSRLHSTRTSAQTGALAYRPPAPTTARARQALPCLSVLCIGRLLTVGLVHGSAPTVLGPPYLGGSEPAAAGNEVHLTEIVRGPRSADSLTPRPSSPARRSRRSASLALLRGHGSGRTAPRSLDDSGEGQVVVDLDGTLIGAHSEREHATPTFRGVVWSFAAGDHAHPRRQPAGELGDLGPSRGCPSVSRAFFQGGLGHHREGVGDGLGP
jgi:hypothetical protein